MVAPAAGGLLLFKLWVAKKVAVLAAIRAFVTHEKTHAKLKSIVHKTAHTTMQFEDALAKKAREMMDNIVRTGSSSGINSRTPPPPPPS
jgi:hypothetical protein